MKIAIEEPEVEAVEVQLSAEAAVDESLFDEVRPQPVVTVVL